MARRVHLLAVVVVPVRAGYAAVWLAVLLSVGGVFGLAAIAEWWHGSAPRTVARALGLDGPDAPELDRRRAAAVAALTAGCMGEHGLPYPAIPEAPLVIPDASLDPEAWAARWGFGVSTSVGTSTAARTETLAEDPVATLLASADATERERYVQVLHGTEQDPGCLGRATEAVYGLRERLLQPVRGALEALDASIETDAAMGAVRSTWVTCTGQATEPLGLPREAPDRRRLPGRLLAWFGERSATVTAVADRDALVALERRVAVDVARCETAFVAGRASVAEPHEAAFVAAHRQALEAIGASIRATEAAYPSAAMP